MGAKPGVAGRGPVMALRALTALTLLVPVAGVAMPATGALSSIREEAQPESPRLAALSRDMGSGPGHKLLDTFWEAVAREGAPMIEPLAGGEQMLVTFLWRAPDREAKVNAAIFGIFTEAPWQSGAPLLHLSGTDIWYRSYRLPTDLRAPYMFIKPSGEMAGIRTERHWPPKDFDQPLPPHDLFLDPLNPHSVEDVYFGTPTRENYLEGPAAPKDAVAAIEGRSAAGRRVELTVDSAILGNARKVVVYVPQTEGKDKGEAPGLLLLFDGLSFLSPGHVPEMLDSMTASGQVAPAVAVFVDFIDQAHRKAELGPNPLFARFIAEELVPLIRTKFGVSTDPARAVIAGASRGGLAATSIAFEHPEIFGNVLAQSSSYWWAPTQEQFGRGWLADKFRRSPRLPICFYLTAGTLESMEAMLSPNREMRDVLIGRGYDVAYREYAGGHTFLNWRDALPEGLRSLMPGRNGAAGAGRLCRR